MRALLTVLTCFGLLAFATHVQAEEDNERNFIKLYLLFHDFPCGGIKSSYKVDKTESLSEYHFTCFNDVVYRLVVNFDLPAEEIPDHVPIPHDPNMSFQKDMRLFIWDAPQKKWKLY